MAADWSADNYYAYNQFPFSSADAVLMPDNRSMVPVMFSYKSICLF